MAPHEQPPVEREYPGDEQKERGEKPFPRLDPYRYAPVRERGAPRGHDPRHDQRRQDVKDAANDDHEGHLEADDEESRQHTTQREER